MKSMLLKLLVAVIILLPLAYLAAVYGKLPQIVPTHFGIDGKPDAYGDKTSLLWLNAILIAVNTGTYLLLKNIHRIDPKRSAGKSQDAIGRIAVAVVVLLSSINIMIMYATLNKGFALDKLMLPVMGLFFAYLGNLMFSVKPNYFVGIRTPWTLEDEENWRKTHQLAGKLWFGGGIVITLSSLLLPAPYSIISFLAIIFIITIIPVVFSYRYFKRSKNMV